MAAAIAEAGLGDAVDLNAVEREGRFLSPIDHPDPAHLLVRGTGLIRRGSASTRNGITPRPQQISPR